MADIIYTVHKGDTLQKIAQKYSIPLHTLLEANPNLCAQALNNEGTLILIPSSDNAPLPTLVALWDPTSPEEPAIAFPNYTPKGSTAIRVGLRRKSMSSRRGRLLHAITQTARRFLGVPYRMGGTTARAFDCSGFVMRVFLINGIRLPRTADVQYLRGDKVPRGQEQPGDLVFFQTYLPGPSHVGIYLGNGNFIHASSSRGVVISNLKDSYFRSRYLGARRLF